MKKNAPTLKEKYLFLQVLSSQISYTKRILKSSTFNASKFVIKIVYCCMVPVLNPRVFACVNLKIHCTNNDSKYSHDNKLQKA